MPIAETSARQGWERTKKIKFRSSFTIAFPNERRMAHSNCPLFCTERKVFRYLQKYFYLRCSQQIRGRKALLLLVMMMMMVWPFFIFPCSVFLGVNRKNFVLKVVRKGKNLVLKGVWVGKNCVSKGVWKGKNFVLKGCEKVKTVRIMVHCFVKNTIFHAADQLSKNLFPPLEKKIRDLKKIQVRKG